MVSEKQKFEDIIDREFPKTSEVVEVASEDHPAETITVRKIGNTALTETDSDDMYTAMLEDPEGNNSISMVEDKKAKMKIVDETVDGELQDQRIFTPEGEMGKEDDGLVSSSDTGKNDTYIIPTQRSGQ